MAFSLDSNTLEHSHMFFNDKAEKRKKNEDKRNRIEVRKIMNDAQGKRM